MELVLQLLMLFPRCWLTFPLVFTLHMRKKYLILLFLVAAKAGRVFDFKRNPLSKSLSATLKVSFKTVA